MHKSRLAARLGMAGAPLLLLALSACGGGSSLYGSSGSGSSGSKSDQPAATSGAGLSVRHTSLGRVLVDGGGRTLYLLTSDKPNKSSCNASCLGYWPPAPALAKGAAPPPGVSAQIGSTGTTAGGQMMTANGWPLYTYVGDQAPGDVSGEGVKSFGGVWYAVSPSGKAIKAATSGVSGGGSGGGYGGRY